MTTKDLRKQLLNRRPDLVRACRKIADKFNIHWMVKKYGTSSEWMVRSVALYACASGEAKFNLSDPDHVKFLAVAVRVLDLVPPDEIQ